MGKIRLRYDTQDQHFHMRLGRYTLPSLGSDLGRDQGGGALWEGTSVSTAIRYVVPTSTLHTNYYKGNILVVNNYLIYFYENLGTPDVNT